MYRPDPQILRRLLSFPSLVGKLRQAFADDYTVPLRHHHDFTNPEAAADSTLLLMPAWRSGHFLGVKIVCIAPENTQHDLPSIHGRYLLFDAVRGVPLLECDAKLLTNLRTAAASALAADFLSRPESSSLLMIGTGSLAPYLIEAHSSVRPIKKVWVWGRSYEKAQKTCQRLNHLSGIDISPVKDREAFLSRADIISAATMSKTPLIAGKCLRPGQHVDLVGSYKPDMREADDDAIHQSHVYADNMEGALRESGDLAIPIRTGILKKDDICGDLFDLCRNRIAGRQSESVITLFKSVGHALEDLAAAELVYEALQKA